MKTALAVMLAGVFGMAGMVGASAQEGGKGKLEGTYKIVSGVRDGTPIGDKGKAGWVKIDAKAIQMGEKLDSDEKFVISYKILEGDGPTKKVDMTIESAPGAFKDAKGAKAYGILWSEKGTVKIAYSLDPSARPTDFAGKAGHSFELARERGKGKKE